MMQNKIFLPGLLMVGACVCGLYSPPVVIIGKSTPAETILIREKIVEVEVPAQIFQSSPEPILWMETIIGGEHSGIITPLMIPNSRPRWDLKFRNGASNTNEIDLRNHIFDEHGIATQRIEKLGVNELIRLHSFLHNGGKL